MIGICSQKDLSGGILIGKSPGMLQTAVLQKENSSGKIGSKDEKRRVMTTQTPFKWRHARSQDHFTLRALVSAVCAQLSEPGGDDAGVVNLAEIDELITMNSGQKWGVSPNGL